MAALARVVLEQPAGGKTRDVVRRLMPDADEGDLTLGAATVVAQVDQALKGSTRAFEALARVSRAGGQGPQEEGERPFRADYALLLADPYMRFHRAVCGGLGGDYFATGGRASAKSSWAALEVVGGMMRDPRASVFVMMRVGKDMRSSVALKAGWAIDLLGVADQWEMSKSPLEWSRPSTGQKVVFKGGDDTSKSKGFEPPPGTYFAFTWFEEFDQFGSMAELRTVLQSVTRGAPEGAPFFRLYTCNPLQFKAGSRGSARIHFLTKRCMFGRPFGRPDRPPARGPFALPRKEARGVLPARAACPPKTTDRNMPGEFFQACRGS